MNGFITRGFLGLAIVVVSSASSGCALIRERGTTMGMNVGVDDFGRGVHVTVMMQIPGEQRSPIAMAKAPVALASSEKSDASVTVAKAETPKPDSSKNDPPKKSKPESSAVDGLTLPSISLAALGSTDVHSTEGHPITAFNLSIETGNAAPPAKAKAPERYVPTSLTVKVKR